MKQGTTHSSMSHLTHLYTVPSLWLEKKTDGSTGLMISLASVYGDSQVAHFLCPHLVVQPIWGWASAPDSEPVSANRISLMAFSSSLIFSWLLLRLLQQSALFTLLCMTGPSCSNLMLLRYESSTATAKQI